MYSGRGGIMKYFITLSLLVVFIFFGCDPGIGNGSSDLPVSTELWALRSDGYIRFYTNDSTNYDYYFWNLYENKNAQNTYEIECKKMSGNLASGYGLVFGASDSGVNQYYCLEIYANGYYRIWYRDNDTRKIIKTVGYSDKLFTGTDKINNLKVALEGTAWTISFNGNQVYQLSNLTEYGSRIGFYVAVGSETGESFPNTPVDVRFRQKQ
jgi:hypothetical protein